ncbi:protein kinase domain-containing protein [Streptomyces acidiscabies]|uniref:Protein kinase domain-containing protein n=1 Tax=Streptomyces acidiscabies TaxID=42234 RepID=A0AAP6BAY5_9ACTN|nr:purine or other phosphorylase 1 [Streptomyces acidiscabies]MBP5935633.1 hypothetical protein [Streptomyces sp. LBUM 1476]MBZ3916480.1 hypothetical protein [Streptomyces acidiscabies]MDX2961147.1 hypothetical protein [Streptomyces acidiscabies]MDX3022899.1 hypothetical protein [Streptomyces acidiscabies]MDX3791854.1 hypothetical protein [Streptomyces acidiscabies]
MRDTREKENDGPTVVVLTASDIEFDAVERLLAGDPESAARDEIGTVYRLGWIDGTPWRVALAEIGTGNGGAAVVATHAVKRFQPRLVMFVGTAGSLKESVAVGDVVVATKVYGVHGAKVTDDGFHARPESWQLAHEVRQSATTVHRRWRRDPAAPPVHFKPVAAGEVVHAGEDTAYSRQLRRHYEDAVAVEMESAGVSQAAHMHRGWPAVTVRGIGDRTREGTELGARNAAAFAVAVIREVECDEGEVAVPEVVVRRAGAPRGWRAGASVRVGHAEFLLEADQLGELGGEFWGRALWLGRRQQHAWLRRVDGPGDGREALRLENEFLTRRPYGALPGRGVHEELGGTAVLALPWPGRSRGPAPTAAEAYGTEPVFGSAQGWVLLACGHLAETLGVLHEQGVTHRCLAPETVLLWTAGKPRLRDLGAAFRRPRPGEGYAGYRAPEQEYATYRPDLIGPPTDVYQLAALTYRLLTGTPPTPPRVLPLRTYLPDAPAHLDDLLRAALAPDPAARPTAPELAAHLRRSENHTSC